MKTKYKDMKLSFLESKPKFLQFLRAKNFSLNSVISIEQKGNQFIFRGLGFMYIVNTDMEFSFFKSQLFFNEVSSEAS